MVTNSVPILLDSTRSTEILSWKEIFERVESSKIQKWHSLDSLEFSLLCFERVPSTCRVFLKEHCNFYASPSSIEAERAFSTCGQFATRPRSRLNDDTLNALLITNKFYKKEKLLAKEKDLAKQKLSSKPAKAAETTETVEAVVQKSSTKNRQNI